MAIVRSTTARNGDDGISASGGPIVIVVTVSDSASVANGYGLELTSAGTFAIVNRSTLVDNVDLYVFQTDSAVVRTTATIQWKTTGSSVSGSHVTNTQFWSCDLDFASTLG